MTYPFVKARYDFGPRTAPLRAFVIHMAEGGGTVAFLAKDNPNKVSVHYVIERTGRIVQMLGEDRISGSINPRDIRASNDADGFYGVTAAKAVMGDLWSDPNRGVISVEIEGYAVSGPNAAQSGSLKTLVEDVRSRHPGIGLLGHRDFADYKACPGHYIHWPELGGHGPAQEDNPDMLPITDPAEKLVDIAVGKQLYDLNGQPKVKVSVAQNDRPSPFGTKVGTVAYRAVYVTTGGTLQLLLVRTADAVLQPVPAPDCSAVQQKLDTATKTLADRTDRLARIKTLASV